MKYSSIVKKILNPKLSYCIILQADTLFKRKKFKNLTYYNLFSYKLRSIIAENSH